MNQAGWLGRAPFLERRVNPLSPRLARWLIALLAVASFDRMAPPAAAAQEGDDGPLPFDVALAKYQVWVKRPALFKRTRSREELAKTGDTRALEALIADYKKPEEPKDHVRSLIVDLTTTHCGRDEQLPLYAKWRAAAKKPDDAWLWNRSLRLNARYDDFATIEAAIASAPSIQLRCAALAALVPPTSSEFDLLARLPGFLTAKVGKPAEEGVLAQTVAQLLLQQKAQRDEEPFTVACTAVIATLDSKSIPLSSKRVVARCLARLFDKQGVPDMNPDVWRRELAARAWATRKDGDKPSYVASFAGIPAGGVRFCYVIDCSDSMLKPVAGRAKEKASETGPKKKPDPSGLPAINWDKVHTRFDLARELVLASIRQLDEQKRFAIVLFGDGADPLDSTKELIFANKKNLARVEAELNAMEPGPASAARPDGTLLGKTNLQGGFDRAFRITTKGLEATSDDVDLDRIEEGADTIFLFSDGEPSWDDFNAIDSTDAEDNIGDPETHAPLARLPLIDCFGPYVEHHHLLNEVRRLNFFRGVEIHCVGTGEAPMGLLQQLANLGMGTAKQIGKDQQ